MSFEVGKWHAFIYLFAFMVFAFRAGPRPRPPPRAPIRGSPKFWTKIDILKKNWKYRKKKISFIFLLNF